MYWPCSNIWSGPIQHAFLVLLVHHGIISFFLFVGSKICIQTGLISLVHRKQQPKMPGKVFIPFLGSSCQQKDGQRLPGTYPLRKGVSIRVRRVLEIAPQNPQTGINPSIQVDNCDYQKIKYLVLKYIYIYNIYNQNYQKN
jgi:hypothetical protein